MTMTLSKTETNLLVEAAGRGGTLIIPETTKPATRQRLLGRFERDGLVRAHEDGHVLTPAGYGVVGRRGSEPEPFRVRSPLLRRLVRSLPAPLGPARSWR